jgi:hypothetical protein
MLKKIFLDQKSIGSDFNLGRTGNAVTVFFLNGGLA